LPCVRVAKTVDVSVKKNLVRAHVVALKDVSKSVVVLVEAKIAPVAERCDEGCRHGWMIAS
jgi:hypothetical protein